MNRYKTLILSPHSDDISMILFKTLKESFFPNPILAITLFSVSKYVKKSKLLEFNHNKEKITKRRILEDCSFLRTHNIDYAPIKCPDADVRGVNNFKAHNIEIDLNLCNQILSDIKQLIRGNALEIIIASKPYGYEQHIDHRMTFIIASELSNLTHSPLYITDDLPYSILPSIESFSKILYLKQSNADIYLKHKLMEIYKSQMCSYFHNKINYLDILKNNDERFFLKNI